MPIIIEDGTVVEAANSYVTLDEVDAYYESRNITDWAGEAADDDTKIGFIIQAADYLNAVFQWNGLPMATTQTMAIPTDEVSEIPVGVKFAQIIIAREIARGTLTVSALGDRVVSSERKKLEGVGEKEVHYDTTSMHPAQTSTVLGLLRPFIRFPSRRGIQVARREYV